QDANRRALTSVHSFRHESDPALSSSNTAQQQNSEDTKPDSSSAEKKRNERKKSGDQSSEKTATDSNSAVDERARALIRIAADKAIPLLKRLIAQYQN